MNRTISSLLTALGVFLLLAAYCAAGWLASPEAGERALGTLPAAGTILAGCALLYLVNERLLSGSSPLVAILYIVLATARPAGLFFTPLHAASLLLAVSVTAYLLFNSIRTSMGTLVLAWAGLGTAALLAPPLAWLAPVYAVFSVRKTDEKMRFWVAALLAFILPLAVWTGINYLRGGDSPGEILQGLWSGMCAAQRPSFSYPAVSLCRMALTTLVVILAVFHVGARLDSYKTAQFHACLRLIILTLALSLLVLFFYFRPGLPSGLLTALPAAPLLGEYFSHAARNKRAGTLAIILGLVLAAERASFFVNL